MRTVPKVPGADGPGPASEGKGPTARASNLRKLMDVLGKRGVVFGDDGSVRLRSPG
jgi:hypothetical protein